MPDNVVEPMTMKMLPKKKGGPIMVEAVQDVPPDKAYFEQIQDMDKHLVGLQMQVLQMEERLETVTRVVVLLHEKLVGPIPEKPQKPKPKKPGERNILI